MKARNPKKIVGTISSKVLNRLERQAAKAKEYSRALREIRFQLKGILCKECPMCDGSALEARRIAEAVLRAKAC